jgi:adenosylcobinamide hydrolase
MSGQGSEIENWREYMRLEPDDNRRFIRELPGGEKIYRKGRSLMIIFPDRNRLTLSTGYYHGGFYDGPSVVFNTQCLPKPLDHVPMNEYNDYVAECAVKAEIDPLTSVGLGTGVNMDDAAIVTITRGRTSVTAIATAGVETNAGRAGDPASYDALDTVKTSGTIVVILVIKANLPPKAMVRAIITATEAKTCALQQLMVGSKYSKGLASGTGTDQIAVICDKSSCITLTSAGNHSLLGELIGKTVTEAVSKALDNWGGMNPDSCKNVIVRLERFGVTHDDFITEGERISKKKCDDKFRDALEITLKKDRNVALTAAVVHIMDEISWNLLPRETGNDIMASTIKIIIPDSHFAINGDPIKNLVTAFTTEALLLLKEEIQTE